MSGIFGVYPMALPDVRYFRLKFDRVIYILRCVLAYKRS